MFSAPIPGQSLTSEPKNSPWENPPEIDNPEDALLFHIKRLNTPEKTKATLNFLELGIDVVTLVEGLLRAAVSEGRHSIDVSLIIAPIIHELITGNAKAAGIEFDEGLDDPNEVNQEEIDYAIQNKKSQKILDEFDNTGKVNLSSMDEMSETVEETPETLEEESMQKEKPMGLMSRGNM